ncbi:MAG: methyltransferase domain-containing protein [Chloroflexi bacterium]|nr:methyltransferase domain-containing protein [Chloroflexota bacterium]
MELMLQLGKIKPNARILDIGCGAAYQCSLLKSRGYNIVCTDVANGVTYTNLDVLSDCSHLPSKDNCFDVVYSSHLLEHAQDKTKALHEMMRVLDPNGNIYVIVPTWIWKIGQLITYYPIPIARFAKWVLSKEEQDLAMKTEMPKSVGKFKSLCLKAKRNCFPEVHGTSLSNLEELRSFRISSWLKLFRSSGLNVTKVVIGPLYVPSELPLPTINASRLGICSSIIFALS